MVNNSYLFLIVVVVIVFEKLPRRKSIKDVCMYVCMYVCIMSFEFLNLSEAKLKQIMTTYPRGC